METCERCKQKFEFLFDDNSICYGCVKEEADIESTRRKIAILDDFMRQVKKRESK